MKYIAYIIREKIEVIDPFIQEGTAKVCPACNERCCINRHGYYDNLDVLYIRLLGIEPPLYKEGLVDTDPCQFLSEHGCSKPRWFRPFRCNWYFCGALLDYMEKGSARPYREFIKTFNEILDLRCELLNKSLIVGREVRDNQDNKA